jgi:hypothetical protein
MTTSQTQSTGSTSVEKLPTRLIAYHQQRAKNRAFEEVIAFFARRAEYSGMTKKEIADRLGKDPSQITRWLSGPGNWTLETISDLLVAMDAEMEFSVIAFEDIRRANYAHPLTLERPGSLPSAARNPAQESQPRTVHVAPRFVIRQASV